jgi:GNAT superfamily N-acetyltransferase
VPPVESVESVESVEGGEWELKRMFVDPAARGAGVASGLLEQAERAVRRLGGNRMRLETGVEQPSAIRLYERSGYRRVANYPPYEQDPVVVCFRKSLTTRGQDPWELN